MSDFDKVICEKFQGLYDQAHKAYQEDKSALVSIGTGSLINLVNMIAYMQNRLMDLEKKEKERLL